MNNTTTPTRRYEAASCHEQGYAWNIEAPSSLSAAEVENLQRALVDYSTRPTQSDLPELLEHIDYCAAFQLVNRDELAQVRFTLQRVHQDGWAQDFNCVRETEA